MVGGQEVNEAADKQLRKGREADDRYGIEVGQSIIVIECGVQAGQA